MTVISRDCAITVFDEATPFSDDECTRLEELICASFPRNEQILKEEYRVMLEPPEHYLILGHQDENGLYDAFAVNILLPDDVLYLEYLVTDETQRGKGLGGVILDELLNYVEDPSHESGRGPSSGLPCFRLLVAEIERPGDTAMAARRASFYERHGMTVNGGEYTQPAMQESCKSIPMYLITYPHAVEDAAFEHLKALIYGTVYPECRCSEIEV